MQGVITCYDPTTGEGAVMADADRAVHQLAPDALAGSVFRMLRQGQRVVFELDEGSLASRVRLGSEVDLGMGSVQL